MTVRQCSSIQDHFHQRMLEFRAIDSLLFSEKFETAYGMAKATDVDSLILILKSGDITRVRKWIEERLAGPLKYQSYRKIRERAKHENVHRWSRLDRDELLEALLEKGIE